MRPLRRAWNSSSAPCASSRFTFTNCPLQKQGSSEKSIWLRKRLWKYVADAEYLPPANDCSTPVSNDVASSGLSAGFGRMGKPPPCPKDSSKLGSLMPSEYTKRRRVPLKM